MRVKVFPSIPNGVYTPPPSKSVSHRTAICSYLAGGQERVENLGVSKDITATMQAMKKIVAEIKSEGRNEKITIDCVESGSTLRFLIPLTSALGLDCEFLGQGELLNRPLSVYEKIFLEQKIPFKLDKSGLFVGKGLRGGNFIVDGNISSQFITGLLMTLPLLKGNSKITVKEPFESRSYVEITLNIMQKFGINAQFTDNNIISVEGGQAYKACDITVEADYSQVAFFMVLSSIKGKLEFANCCSDTKQGDRAIADIIKACGADFEREGDMVSVSNAKLKGCEINLSDCPDLGPILTVLGSFCGDTTITNAARLRIKESDRIAAMEQELKKLGVDITSDESNIFIKGRKPLAGEITVKAHNDHRIAMSLAIFACCAEFPVTIEGAEAVSKSYPHFFEDLANLGVKIEMEGLK